ncbi:uncharacterized protein G2W53_010153 [Senna tora]|uniref:Uncharacterized protein n=1 Tax=Senna tora TaxID=362788 RepID=A0A834WZP4_9FABA|nr:uncharacterized protein G2W53_010153 [Senna tora]
MLIKRESEIGSSPFHGFGAHRGANYSSVPPSPLVWALVLFLDSRNMVSVFINKIVAPTIIFSSVSVFSVAHGPFFLSSPFGVNTLICSVSIVLMEVIVFVPEGVLVSGVYMGNLPLGGPPFFPLLVPLEERPSAVGTRSKGTAGLFHCSTGLRPAEKSRLASTFWLPMLYVLVLVAKLIIDSIVSCCLDYWCSWYCTWSFRFCISSLSDRGSFAPSCRGLEDPLLSLGDTVVEKEVVLPSLSSPYEGISWMTGIPGCSFITNPALLGSVEEA